MDGGLEEGLHAGPGAREGVRVQGWGVQAGCGEWWGLGRRRLPGEVGAGDAHEDAGVVEERGGRGREAARGARLEELGEGAVCGVVGPREGHGLEEALEGFMVLAGGGILGEVPVGLRGRHAHREDGEDVEGACAGAPVGEELGEEDVVGGGRGRGEAHDGVGDAELVLVLKKAVGCWCGVVGREVAVEPRELARGLEGDGALGVAREVRE